MMRLASSFFVVGTLLLGGCVAGSGSEDLEEPTVEEQSGPKNCREVNVGGCSCSRGTNYCNFETRCDRPHGTISRYRGPNGGCSTRR
jgi:hypothetical protein